eukprot:scaffold8378_cov113-Isochrysis_galbana.AAC.1
MSASTPTLPSPKPKASEWASPSSAIGANGTKDRNESSPVTWRASSVTDKLNTLGTTRKVSCPSMLGRARSGAPASPPTSAALSRAGEADGDSGSPSCSASASSPLGWAREAARTVDSICPAVLSCPAPPLTNRAISRLSSRMKRPIPSAGRSAPSAGSTPRTTNVSAPALSHNPADPPSPDWRAVKAVS